LTGVRVVDLSQAHAGPAGTQILGDLGADVIKVESPIGELVRFDWVSRSGGHYMQALNRNKRDVVLDLWTKSGREAFCDLVRVSDVVLDNFRVGVMKKLGADYDSLKKLNPRIISASILGYGSSGPYSTYPSYDDLGQAMSGMASLCGEPGGKPMRSAAAIGDISAGILCTYGVVVALYERERTGQGRRVEVNLLDSCMALLDTMFQHYFSFGHLPPPQGSRHPVSPLLGYYKTRNGYIALGPCWPRICRVIDREWMIDDPRFREVGDRMKNKKEMEDLIEEALQEADSEDWIELLRAEDIAVSPVNTLDKVAEDPQVAHNGTILQMEHSVYGKVRAVACPIRMPGAVEGESSPPPMLGEHTDEVLRTILGYSDEKMDRLRQEQEENAEELQKHARKARA